MSSNRNQQQQDRAIRGMRESAKEDKNTTTIPNGANTYISLVCVVNILNVFLYNTGWMNWKDDGVDIGIATTLVGINIGVIFVLQMFKK